MSDPGAGWWWPGHVCDPPLGGCQPGQGCLTDEAFAALEACLLQLAALLSAALRHEQVTAAAVTAASQRQLHGGGGSSDRLAA